MTASDLTCPECGNPAVVTETQYGERAACYDCGLWSWDRKPLVSAEVHQLRKEAHEIFDAVWLDAPSAYSPPPTDAAGVKRVQRATRNRGYMMLASLTGMPEPECHMGTQTDPDKLRRIIQAARLLSPTSIRAWWERYGTGHKKQRGRA